MTAIPRCRKVIKWSGAVLTALLVIVWLGSRWQLVGWMKGTRMIQARAGCLDIAIMSRPAPAKMEGWHRLAASPPRLEWWYSIDDDPVWKNWRGAFPLWWGVVPLATITVCAWYLDVRDRRRARFNLCFQCHYNRAGLAADAVCPGSAAPRHPHQARRAGSWLPWASAHGCGWAA